MYGASIVFSSGVVLCKYDYARYGASVVRHIATKTMQRPARTTSRTGWEHSFKRTTQRWGRVAFVPVHILDALKAFWGVKTKTTNWLAKETTLALKRLSAVHIIISTVSHLSNHVHITWTELNLTATAWWTVLLGNTCSELSDLFRWRVRSQSIRSRSWRLRAGLCARPINAWCVLRVQFSSFHVLWTSLQGL